MTLSPSPAVNKLVVLMLSWDGCDASSAVQKDAVSMQFPGDAK